MDYREFQSDLKGEYWELSEAMLSKAQKNLAQSKLTFHLGDFKSNPDNQFDEIWLHFVLDTFPDLELGLFLSELRKSMKPSSTIYLTDFFNPQSPFHRVIHATMLAYFRMLTKHQRTDVPDYEIAFQKAGFQKLDEIRKRKGWIRAQLWESAAN